MYYQRTLNKSIEFSGIGTHNGEYCSVTIMPAPANYGIKFFLKKEDNSYSNPINASIDSVSSTLCSTTITNEFGDSVSTIEHLMATLGALQIFNAKIILSNKEFPILDGSAKCIVEKIQSVGIRNLRRLQRCLVVNDIVNISENDRSLTLEPANNLQFDISISMSWDKKVWSKNQSFYTAINEEVFIQDIAYARTFGFFSDMAKLQAMNLIKGTSLENAVIIGVDGAILNEEGLRHKHEFIKHKAIDLLGDISLVGMPIIAKISGNGVSHTMNNNLLKKLLSSKAYKIVTIKSLVDDNVGIEEQLVTAVI